MTFLKEYRCTRPNYYAPGTPGHKDPKSRQGYYVVAESEENAHRAMRVRFPGDSHFTVRLWRKNLPAHCKPDPIKNDGS